MSKKKKRKSGARGIFIAILVLLVAGAPVFWYLYKTYRDYVPIAWGKVPPSARLAAPTDPGIVTLKLKQRSSQALPGFHDGLFVHVGNINLRIVPIRVALKDGTTILPSTKTKDGEMVAFRVNKRSFYLKVKEVRQRIVRQDYAILEFGELPGEPPARR